MSAQPVVLRPPEDRVVAELRLYVALELPSAANLRESYQARAARVAGQRKMIKLIWLSQGRLVVDPPAEVTITRIAPLLLDDDNLVAACKAVRDEVAQLVLRVDDRDARVKWVCRAATASRRSVGLGHVEVLVRHIGEAW